MGNKKQLDTAHPSQDTLVTPAHVMAEVRDQDMTFEGRYTLGKELGHGAFSKVYTAIDKTTGQTYAVKVIDKASLEPEDVQALELEVDILRTVRHPHIVRFVDFFDNDRQSYQLVTELLQGGELFDRIVKKAYYSEKEAREVVFILLSAIQFLHENNIVHRDLKPENLLLTSTHIKVADFGFADHVHGLHSLTLQCGTPGYVAPEILEHHTYGKPVDMWSVGVITYILLGGYPPFHDDDVKKMHQKTIRCQYEFHDEYWGAVSTEAKDLIAKMLQANPLVRLTAEEALRHPWMMADPEALAARDLSGTLNAIRKFNARRKFKAAAHHVLAANFFKHGAKSA